MVERRTGASHVDGRDAVKLENLLLGFVSRLRYVWRHTTSHFVHRESVAEHSYFTAMYAMVLSRYCGMTRDEQLDAIQRAIVHDIEECRTGDIPRPFKYSDPKLTEMIHRTCHAAASQVVTDMVPLAMHAWLLDRWKNAKTDDVSGLVVAISDHWAMLSYVLQEVDNGNASLARHVDGVQDSYNSIVAKFEREFRGHPSTSVLREKFNDVLKQTANVQARLTGNENPVRRRRPGRAKRHVSR